MRKSFFFVALLTLHISAAAQWQVRLFGGIANYQGDLLDGVYVPQATRPAFGVFIGYELSDRLLVRGGLMVGKVSGHDKYNSKDYLKLRNLNFETSIAEGSVIGELNLRNMTYSRWSPYLYGGVAAFHFNPYVYDVNAQKVFLKPLSTEGQGLSQYPEQKPYRLTQLAIPLGGGLKYALTENIHLGIEAGMRKIFTDYLDDVSTNYADAADLFNARGQLALNVAYRGDEVAGGDINYPAKGARRGSPKYKDLYYFTGLTLAFRLQSSGPGGGGRSGRGGRSGYGCPANPM